MADNLTREQRSATMRKVRGGDTAPEIKVRRILRAMGLTGYRLHRKDVPGKPDIAFVGRRVAIFVHGCFWHGHGCPRGNRSPKENAEYWSAKIERNRQRDGRHSAELVSLGWKALVIWECELKDLAEVRRRLAEFMGICDG